MDKNVTPDDFREYLNSIEPRIQFTSEIGEDRALMLADLSRDKTINLYSQKNFQFGIFYLRQDFL